MFDREAMLERMGGDQELLDEIVALFLDDGPKMLDRLREAVARREAGDIERAAHSLKGALLNMAADPVAEVALEIETMGRKGQVAPCGDVFATLEERMDRLQQQLRGTP